MKLSKEKELNIYCYMAMSNILEPGKFMTYMGYSVDDLKNHVVGLGIPHAKLVGQINVKEVLDNVDFPLVVQETPAIIEKAPEVLNIPEFVPTEYSKKDQFMYSLAMAVDNFIENERDQKTVRNILLKQTKIKQNIGLSPKSNSDSKILSKDNKGSSKILGFIQNYEG